MHGDEMTKVDAAFQVVENASSKGVAINALQNFIHTVELQREVEIPDADANALIAAAQACLAIRKQS